jgi:hypothetical protein
VAASALHGASDIIPPGEKDIPVDQGGKGSALGALALGLSDCIHFVIW